MPELVAPDTQYQESFLAAMAEFAAEGRAGDGSMIGADLADFGATWTTSDGFADYVVATRSAEPRRPGHVACTNRWWVEGEKYLGRIAVRHELTDFLREVGGHVGYDVRRSARGRGHATAMLAAVLPVCRDLGIDPALVTCDTDNTASRRVIEKCGGVLEDERQGKLRYWVPTT